MNAATSSAIERIYAGLSADGVAHEDLVTQYGPCITLLVVGDRAPSEVVVQMAALRLAAALTFGVTFTQPGIIHGTPPTLSLRVSPVPALLTLHSDLYSEFPEDEVHLHYRPAHWQPHLKLCNIRHGHAAGAKLVAAVAARWAALDGVADGLEIIQYPPAQSVWNGRLRQAAAPPLG